MTISVICDDNLAGLQFSMQQPGRTHTYKNVRITGIRKTGRYFEVRLAEGGIWITAEFHTNIVTIDPAEEERIRNAEAEIAEMMRKRNE